MFDQEILSEAQGLIDQCRAAELWVSTAESCTGGLISGALTSVPGASDVVGACFVTYSNEAKQSLLGVLPHTLDTHGAVSPETAGEMALGCLLTGAANLTLAVTGIAGPGGGSAVKPVGLVYLACASEISGGVVEIERAAFGDVGRDEVRRRSVLQALQLGRRVLAAV